MGQIEAMPLPARIPVPTSQQKLRLEEMGIEIVDSVENNRYVSYLMPKGWRMIDNSEREDTPLFFMVDNENMIRVTVWGNWKGDYNSKLWISIPNTDSLKKYTQPKTAEMTANENSLSTRIGKLGAALTPREGPFIRKPVPRKEDYVTS